MHLLWPGPSYHTMVSLSVRKYCNVHHSVPAGSGIVLHHNSEKRPVMKKD